MIIPVVRLIHRVLRGSSLIVFSGIVFYFMEDWAGIILNAMLGGELLSCSIIVILT